MEFIDLHSVFKDNLVISSITNYFINSETPIICYEYNSKYLYPPAGHVIIGNLNVIPDARISNIISKGLNIDFPLVLISLNVLERSLLL